MAFGMNFSAATQVGPRWKGWRSAQEVRIQFFVGVSMSLSRHLRGLGKATVKRMSYTNSCGVFRRILVCPYSGRRHIPLFAIIARTWGRWVPTALSNVDILWGIRLWYCYSQYSEKQVHTSLL